MKDFRNGDISIKSNPSEKYLFNWYIDDFEGKAITWNTRERSSGRLP